MKIRFSNIKNLKINGLRGEKTTDIKKCLENTIKKIYDRAEREVPEYGDFAAISEKFSNPDKSLNATDFEIKLFKTPKNIEDHQILRDIVINAYNNPSPYAAQKLVAVGTKSEILEKLKSKEFLADVIDAVKSLSNNLKDI